MTVASNSYADKVFAEHPIGLWSLDEKADYGSLIPDMFREIYQSAYWHITGGTKSLFSETLPLPIFDGSPITKITTNNLSGPTYGTVTLNMNPVISANAIDYDAGSFTIGTYIYPYSKTLSVNLGYVYFDKDGNQSDPIATNFAISRLEEWSFISETFDIPEGIDPESIYSGLIPFITITYHGPTTSYEFLMHGITIGQKSEQFNVLSLGQQTFDINESRTIDIALSGIYGIPAKVYGLKSNDGYYLSKPSYPTSLCATNSDIPMVFGAQNSTRLIKNENGLPSLIIPGMTFLNSDGKYSDITFETWIKIQSIATEPTRIFGPMASEDGIYVNDAFMILKIGDNIGSYYVGEWDRPMLLAIRQSVNIASLIINGEEVITLNFISDNISLPSKFNSLGQDQDWLGFYCSDSVPQMNVDCVGIYPYAVPNIVEKRRWIYGQGVETPENIVGAALGSSVAIDYTVANYAKNYTYPDIGKFEQGINENLLIQGNAISLPEYSLPEISFNNKTTDEWYAVVPDVDDTYGDAINLKPTSAWSDTDGYLLFPKLNLLSQDVKAFYGVFESNPNDPSKQILFYVENEITGDALEITLENTVISYNLKTQLVSGAIDEQPIYSDSYHIPGDFILAGLNIDNFVSAFGGRVSKFFGTKQNLKVYVGGSRAFQNTFSGKIYRVGFCTARNLQKISYAYTSQGIANGYNSLDTNADYIRDSAGFNDDNSVTTTWESTADAGNTYFGNSNNGFGEILDGGHVYSILIDHILAHVASYTLSPKTYLGKFILDVAVNGYWQDYIPLSYFAKYVKDGTVDSNLNSNKYLDVDFLQFNISYPELKKFSTGYYDTEGSIVKTYISFQYLQTNSSINLSSLLYEQKAPQSGVVVPGSDWTTIQKTKYEVVNDMIVYPPDGMDFGMIAVVVHVEIISSGAVQNPVKIRSIEIASQALNAFVPNAIGTKHGAPIYPYRKSAEYYDYKGRNPFSIYKGSTPYLYLTSHTGLRLRDLEGSNVIRGFTMPINKNSASYYKVGAIQMAMRFDGEYFNDYVTEIFEVEATSSETTEYIKFYIERVDTLGKRARIYPIDAKTGLTKTGITFYLNGNQVSQAVIDLNTWNILGISFSSALDFSSNVGAIRVTSNMLFNNVSHYQITASDEAAKTVYRKWAGVLSVNDNTEPWNYWLNGDPGADPVVLGSKWKEVLFVNNGTSGALVNGATVYNKYSGTDRFVIDYISDAGVELRIKNYEYSFYDDVKWSSNIVRPV